VAEPDADEPYDLVLAPGARRALTDALPEAAAYAAWEFISGPLVTAPRRVGAALRDPFAGQWRARRGEYRVRYEIDDDTHTVRVLDIDHRRDAYRT
jgi:mRNA-degrading endonuclease RelE of RelBE toxin-antitoxin system